MSTLAKSNLRRDIAEAIELIRAIEQNLLKKGEPGGMRRASRLVSGLVVFLCTAALSAASSVECQFIWDEANARMAAARSPAEFSTAANTYRQLMKLGVRNGALFHNMGTALVMAGRHEEALAALLRAERYAGTTDDLERNIQLAMNGGKTDNLVSLPWQRQVLFWHYGLAASTRITVALAAFSVLWLAMVLRRLGFRQTAGHIVVLSLVVLILFGSSSAASLHAENRERRMEAAGGAVGGWGGSG